MKRFLYIILQDIQALFLLCVIAIGVIILWLKGELKFDD
jgi:hypothetical protein